MKLLFACMAIAFVAALRPAAIPDAPPKSEAVIAFTGDLMAHRWQLDDAYDKETGRYDFDRCFEPVAGYLKEADFTVGNLETVFAGEGETYSCFPRFNTPDSYASALKNAGFDFVTNANNHILDRNWDGAVRTLDVLDENGLGHTGVFRTRGESLDIYVREINGIRFALLAFTYGTNGIPVPGDKTWGVNILDERLIADQIGAAKKLGPDFIIVLPHMGNEYEEKPSAAYRRWAVFMLEAGADVVIASHPHVIQPPEFVRVADAGGGERECFIMHSMGNFISSQRTIPRDAGLLLKMRFEKTGASAEIKNISFIPTWVKFVNDKGAYDIQTISAYDGITSYENGNPYGLRQRDVVRLRQANDWITEKMLGSAQKLRREYNLLN